MSSWTWTLHRYRRPLREALRIGRETLSERVGLYIEAIDPAGHRHLAEYAPLPGLHEGEDCAAAEATWTRWREEGFHPTLSSLDLDRPYWGILDWPELTPALQSSVEMLLLSFILQERPEALPRAPLSSQYELCDLLYLSETLDQRWCEQLEDLKKRESQCLKVKIGRFDSSLEMERLRSLRSALGPRVALRLDANGGLDKETLERWDDFLQDWPLAFIEDPLPQTERVNPPLKGAMKAWSRARDERAVSGNPSLETDPSEVAVLKPNVVRLSRFLKFLRSSSRRDQPLVLSNAYESPLSLQLYAYLYSRYVSNPLALGFGTERTFAPCASEWPLAARGPWPARAFPSRLPLPTEIVR